MTLKELSKQIRDLELLYGDAVVEIKFQNNARSYKIISIDGFMGGKRPDECRDPNMIIINAKE